MTVTFCGHGKMYYDYTTENKLEKLVENLILDGADEFLLGGYGNFDKMSAKIVKKVQKRYPHIKSTLVIPYLDRKYDLELYDSTVYPPLENTPARLSIIKRNQWMVENAHIIISYVKYSYGGSWKTLSFAKQKNKKIIDLCNQKDAE